MKLYVLIRSLEDAHPRLTFQLLQRACQHQDVELVSIEQEKLAFNVDYKSLIEDNSALYRLAAGSALALAERLIIRPGLATIYEDWRIPPLSTTWGDTLFMQEKGVPIIDTTFLFAFLGRQELEEAVDKLGGYPIVVKCTGLSHGQGVFLCADSGELEALVSRFDKGDYHKLALRRFIKGAQHIRLVVIGRQVADAIKYDQPSDDFRTNAVKVPTAASFPASEDIKALAVSAAQANGVRMAGVDVLIGQDGKAVVAEVNTPCNFGRNYLTNGKNLAEELVKMLTSDIDK